MRRYIEFRWKGARYRISSPSSDCIVREIKRQRGLLESYIEDHREFAFSLEPLRPDPRAPEIARWMAEQAAKVGVGPMAAVAGAIAEKSARAALSEGAEEAIVENGGDIFLASAESVLVGLYAGSVLDNLGFEVKPSLMPISICSSSSFLGHSLSLGRCNLATVVAVDAALADAAATRLCNLVREEADVPDALDSIMSVAGIRGVMVVKNDKIGMAGELPELVKAGSIGGEQEFPER